MKPDLYTDIGDILQSMGDAFVSLDRQWRFNFINDKALRLMARSREELIGKTLWEAFPDTVGTIFESEYRRAMEHHVTTSFETYYPTYDMWLEVRAYPHNEGLSLFYTDSTEQKKAGEDLLEISRRFQLFARLNPAGIFHLDHEGKWLFVNDLWLEMTGFDKDEVLGRTWTDVLQPENPEGDAWFGEESIKAGEFINSQFQFRHRRTREILQIRMKATPIPAGDKKLKGYVGTIEDITEQLKAHQIITESEKWFRSIADNAPVMIWNSAADKSFNYFNKA